jgi:catechol 2,3-dioxygenase-like lactoylglutathione lyase family enzyme
MMRMTETQGKFSITRADHTGFTVDSLSEALAFWNGVLGFEIDATFDLGGELLENVTGVEGAEVSIAAVVAPGGHVIELLEYKGPATRTKLSPRPCDVGSVHICFEVDDLDAVLARVARSGWKCQGIPQQLPSGKRAGDRIVYVRGTDGITVEFIEPARARRASGSGRAIRQA